MDDNSRRMIRISNELRNYQEKDCEECNRDGIYIFQSSVTEDMWYGLIVGPEDTPYQHGYLLLKIEFPMLYPFQPPQITFVSLDPNCRIHPNLYHTGRVCLSLINTWGSDEYSPGLGIIKILRSIQSILITNPIEAEPLLFNTSGFSGASVNSEGPEYREMVRYDILCLYQYHMVNDHLLPANEQKISRDVSAQVYPIISKLFLENYDKSLAIIEQYQQSSHNQQTYHSRIYPYYQCYLDYTTLARNFKELKCKIDIFNDRNVSTVSTE